MYDDGEPYSESELGLDRADDSLNWKMVTPLVPRKGRHPVLPRLSTRQQVALLCRVLFREGYDDHIAGHITLRLGDGSMLVNPWELAWDEVTASDIVRLAPDGSIMEGEWNVTPAINLHVEVHAAREDVKVIIHNHSKWGSVWAAAHRVPPIYDQTGSMVDGDPVLVDEYAGTVNGEEEGRAVVEALGGSKCALLANHGVFVVARDVRQAHNRALTLEWRCRLAWQVEQLGGGRPVPQEVASRLGRMVDGNGSPFVWEAMARREIRRDPAVLD